MKLLFSKERIDFNCLIAGEPSIEEINIFHPHPNIVNGLRLTALGYFLYQSDVEAVHRCLHFGANPNFSEIWLENGEISIVKHPLIIAAGRGENSFEIVKELISSGSKYDDHILNEMLYECMWNINYQLVEWIFSASPNVDPNYREDDNSASVFIVLCMRWNVDKNDEQIAAARFMIQKGADLNLTYRMRGNSANDWKSHLLSSLWALSHDKKVEIINKILEL